MRARARACVRAHTHQLACSSRCARARVRVFANVRVRRDAMRVSRRRGSQAPPSTRHPHVAHCRTLRCCTLRGCAQVLEIAIRASQSGAWHVRCSVLPFVQVSAQHRIAAFANLRHGNAPRATTVVEAAAMHEHTMQCATHLRCAVLQFCASPVSDSPAHMRVRARTRARTRARALACARACARSHARARTDACVRSIGADLPPPVRARRAYDEARCAALRCSNRRAIRRNAARRIATRYAVGSVPLDALTKKRARHCCHYAHRCHICIGTGAHRCHICTATRLPLPHLHGPEYTAAASAPGLGSPLPHLHRDWARPRRICTGIGLAPATSGAHRCHILHRDRAAHLFDAVLVGQRWQSSAPVLRS